MVPAMTSSPAENPGRIMTFLLIVLSVWTPQSGVRRRGAGVCRRSARRPAEEPLSRRVARLSPANRQLGIVTALSQTLLKLTSPGVPDIYQGQELWDFSLVDPDNRRPVDFALRREMLDRLQNDLSAGDDARLSLARDLASHPADPRLKLFVTWQTLRFRREHAGLFRAGSYVPLEVEGTHAAHVVAFARRWTPAAGQPEQVAMVVVRDCWRV